MFYPQFGVQPYPHQGGQGVDSFNARTGVVTPAANDYNAGQITETADRLFMTAAERSTLSVNVAQFGAVGDGVTDDTAALADAFAASPYVEFEPKTYLITGTIAINEAPGRCWINGNGATIKASPAGGAPLANHWFAIRNTNDIDLLRVENLRFDGSAFGTRYDDPYCMTALSLYADLVVVQGCEFVNWYGNGIRGRGTPFVAGNRFFRCAGYNVTTDPGGAQDNYGDAIQWLGYSATAPSVAGIIAGNTMETDPTDYRGRSGIAIDGGVAGTFVGVNVIGNRISGYDRGVHAELWDGAVISGNHIDLAHSPVLVSSCKNTRIVDNPMLKGDSPTSGPYKFGIYVYGTNVNKGTRISGNTIVAGSGIDAMRINWSPDMSITENDITGHVYFLGANSYYATSLTISGNKFRRTGGARALYLAADGTKLHAPKIKDNYCFDSYIETALTDKAHISGNTFYLDTDVSAIKLTSDVRASIIDNMFFLQAGAAAEPVNCWSVRGEGELSGNEMYTDASINMLELNGSAGHNGFFVRRPNYRVMTAGARVPLSFTSIFGAAGGASLPVFASGGTPPAGYYLRGTPVWYTDASGGASPGSVCTTAGWTAPAWAGSTAYYRGNLVTNDSGKVYYCASAGGTSAGSGGPTGTGSSITDGTVTWAYVAASAAAVFKAMPALAS